MDLLEKSRNTLELPAVLEMLAGEAVSEPAKAEALALVPSVHRAEVERLLAETSDAKDMMAYKGSPSLSGLRDVRGSLARADMGGVLNTRELLEIAGVLQSARAVRSYGMSAEKETCIDHLFKMLQTNRFLEDKIVNSIPGEDGEDYSIRPYRSTDGKLYVAVIRDEEMTSGPDGREFAAWEADCFLTVPEPEIIPQTPDSVELDSFRDLFGHSGFTVQYYNEDRDEVRDYYYLAEGGVPYLLLRINSGWLDQIDLDGDGVDELYNSDGLLYFLRDGKVYEADVKSALQTAWPDLSYWDWSYLDRNYRHMPEWGEYQGEEGQADFCRYLYFDGESLQVYRELQNVSYTDHLAGTVDVPSDVVTAANALALDVFQQMKELAAEAQPDDWRVDGVTLIETIPLKDGRSVEPYGVGSSFHAANPGQFFRAGGAWIDEDGWFGGYGDRSPYLTFVVDGGKRALVESDLPDDCSPDSLAFDTAVVELLLKQGYAEITDLDQETLVSYFYFRYYDCLDRIAQLPEADRVGALGALLVEEIVELRDVHGLDQVVDLHV